MTELVTGIDLVREQIRIAAGETLPLHAGARSSIAAAPSSAGSTPRTPPPTSARRRASITRWQPPGGPGVRLDSHVVTGYRVPPNYDSLVAKLLVYQPTRAEAMACMRRALAEFVVEGIKTTIPLHREIFNHSAFHRRPASIPRSSSAACCRRMSCTKINSVGQAFQFAAATAAGRPPGEQWKGALCRQDRR